LGGLLFLLAYSFTLFIRGPFLFAGDGDPGRHIRLGRYMLEHGAIPHIDLFSHTMQGQPFIPFEWLSEVTFAVADRWAGLTGVAILTALLFAGAVTLTYVAIHRSGVAAPIAFSFGFLALLLQAIHVHPRPHMFTTLFTALFVLVLLEVRKGASVRWLLVLPACMAAWVNLHGGFLVGFIVLGAFTVDSILAGRAAPEETAARHRALWLVGILAACFLVSFANPAGWELWPHTTGYLRETYLVDFTEEYKSPDFHDALMKVFLFALLLGTTALALLRSRIALLGLALWLIFSAFSLHSTRNIPLFAVVCTPWLALWVDALIRQTAPLLPRVKKLARWSEAVDRTDASVHGWAFAVLAFLLLSKAGLDRGAEGTFAFDPGKFPVAAVAELRDSGFAPPGPVYNEFIWGGYLLYAWPEVPVFIDGQTDFYGESLTREYRDIRFIQPGWLDRLRERRIAWVIIPPEAPLASALELLDSWKVVYADDTAVVLVSTTAERP